MVLNILIADDAALFRNHIKSAVNLVDIEANFIEVSDGKILFSSYEKYVPEITIVDHRLPNIDVLSFLKKILEIHPIASIIVFVDSTSHDFVKNAKAIGIEEVLFKSVGQFALGTSIKKMLSKKASQIHDLEIKSQQNLTNVLTGLTLDKSAGHSKHVKLTNATIQRRIQNIEELKKIGEGFDSTIKNLYNTNNAQTTTVHENKQSQTRVNSAPHNDSNFFMRELSNEQLITVLRDKIKQLKESKADLELTNDRLNDVVSELEETKRDLSTQKEHLEEQVRMQTKILLKSEKLAAVGELSARIAHDLRNPLNIVKNTSEILKSDLLDRLTENELQRWNRLDRGIYRMSHQIDDVLDFIKQRPLQKTKTKISILLADVFEKISIPDNVEIHLPHNDMVVLCDSKKIEIVFVNLILNAIQAIAEKCGVIDIIIHDETKNAEFVVIEIKDTGPGIPEHLREKIFDPLFTTRQIGTGLGLTSCKRVIEAHGGTIKFESKIGVGTRFFIILPNKTEWDNIDQNKTDCNHMITYNH